MGNIIVKFNGVFPDSTAVRLGELDFNLTNANSVRVYLNGSESIKYILTGNLTAVVNSQTIPSSGTLDLTVSTNRGINLTGTGKFRIWKKYGLTTVSGVIGNYGIPIEQLYSDDFLSSVFTLYNDNGCKWIVDSVAKGIRIGPKTNGITLPLILDCDYSNVTFRHPSTALDAEQVRLNYTSDSTLYGSRLHGDVSNVADIADLHRIDVFTLGECPNAYIDDIAKLLPFASSMFCLYLVKLSYIHGDVQNVLKSFTNLTQLCLHPDNVSIEWKPVFDAWKLAGVVSRTVAIANIGGTLDGDIITGSHSLTFDQSGNWSFN